MSITSKTKQTSENLDYDFEFTNALPSGDNVSTATVTATPAGLTLGTKTISGQTVKQWISGGTDGVTYKVTVVATSVAGRIRELELELLVSNT